MLVILHPPQLGNVKYISTFPLPASAILVIVGVPQVQDVDGVTLGVTLGVAVLLGVTDGVTLGVTVGVGVLLKLVLGVAVLLGVTVFVGVTVLVGVTVTLGVAVILGVVDGVNDIEVDGVTEGVAEGDVWIQYGLIGLHPLNLILLGIIVKIATFCS